MVNFRVSALHLRSTTIVTRLTEHDEVIKSLLRGAPRLGLALGLGPARAGHDRRLQNSQVTDKIFLLGEQGAAKFLQPMDDQH